MPEQVWKFLFVEVLATAFVSKGRPRLAALDDAFAHANDEYRRDPTANPQALAEKLGTWL
jgi:hypothetical protein